MKKQRIRGWASLALILGWLTAGCARIPTSAVPVPPSKGDLPLVTVPERTFEESSAETGPEYSAPLPSRPAGEERRETGRVETLPLFDETAPQPTESTVPAGMSTTWDRTR